MIKRYTPKDIGRIWQLGSKFAMWLVVELAVIEARCLMGIYPSNVITRIRKYAKFSVREIVELDKLIEHDLIAFIETVRKSLPKDLRKYIHDRMTSYDTEEPALALHFRKVQKIVLGDLQKFIDVVRKVVSEHMWTFCMGITHSQDAKPTTFAHRLCVYLEMLERAKENLERVFDQVLLTKISGAVGNYGTIDPELEERVCKMLGLGIRPAASQIVSRDAIARVLNEIAVLGSVIEKMAIDFRQLAATSILEVIEPRKKEQKGSSAMPHKKNPILWERMSGMSRILRANAGAGMENIPTWLERDISQSSVERVILPDSTSLIVYMLRKMTDLVCRMEVRRKQMCLNIGRTFGCWASEEVKSLLCDMGFDTEDVYTFVQQCAFAAIQQRRSFKQVILESKLPRRKKILAELIGTEGVKAIAACFNYRIPLRKNLPVLYRRMSLNSDLALPPN